MKTTVAKFTDADIQALAGKRIDLSVDTRDGEQFDLSGQFAGVIDEWGKHTFVADPHNDLLDLLDWAADHISSARGALPHRDDAKAAIKRAIFRLQAAYTQVDEASNRYYFFADEIVGVNEQ